MDENILKEIKECTQLVKQQAKELELLVSAFMDGTPFDESLLVNEYSDLTDKMDNLNILIKNS